MQGLIETRPAGRLSHAARRDRLADAGSLCLFGAAPDTANLGVAALFRSTLAGLARRLPGGSFTVFDYGRGARRGSLDAGGSRIAYALHGSVVSRRYHRPENLWNMRVRGWLGGLGNPAVRAIRAADAVLDITGGDSFTDLYGPRRFQGAVLRKRLAIEQGVPLILLPQTYGPFRGASARAAAGEIVKRAAMAWARDLRSFEVLKDLLGTSFDPARHVCGVDVAFSMAAEPPGTPLPAEFAGWLEDRSRPVVGVNVSGLIYNDPAMAAARYGFKADYRGAVVRVVERLVGAGCRVLLVPHVIDPEGHPESDPGACREVAERVGEGSKQELVRVLPARFNEAETKWIIARLDWFCGTRMHATIAGLSSGVPTAAIAYSDKTRGVFETVGRGEAVTDPRTATTGEVVDRVWSSWEQRDRTRVEMAPSVAAARREAEEQFDRIAGHVVSGRRRRDRA